MIVLASILANFALSQIYLNATFYRNRQQRNKAMQIKRMNNFCICHFLLLLNVVVDCNCVGFSHNYYGLGLKQTMEEC